MRKKLSPQDLCTPSFRDVLNVALESENEHKTSRKYEHTTYETVSFNYPIFDVYEGNLLLLTGSRLLTIRIFNGKILNAPKTIK